MTKGTLLQRVVHSSRIALAGRKTLWALLCLLLLGAALPLPAQDGYWPSSERWKMDDFFPSPFFQKDNSKSYRSVEEIGEVVYYMRLAGLKPITNTPLPDGESIVRLSFTPSHTHPMFVEVRHTPAATTLSWQVGAATRGYVEHSHYYHEENGEIIDDTEQQYYGNDWVEGVTMSGQKELTPAQWDSLARLLDDCQYLKLSRTVRCSSNNPPNILEYRVGKRYNATYAECQRQGTDFDAMRMLLALADSAWLSSEIFLPNDANGIAKPQFPGGEEAMQQFIAANLVYPKEALDLLKEGDAGVNLIVERDGSLNIIEDPDKNDPYKFYRNAIEVVKLMPRWIPGSDKGSPVRCNHYINVKYVLPDSLRPSFGTPVVDSRRDRNAWSALESHYRDLVVNPADADAHISLARRYHQEYMLPFKPVKEPDRFDSILNNNAWDVYYDRTPVLLHAADSALAHYYRAWELGISHDDSLLYFMPTRQLEQVLGLQPNPMVALPAPPDLGLHYNPYAFVNWPSNGIYDSTVEYDGFYTVDPGSSLFWVKVFSRILNDMEEPVLQSAPLNEGDMVFRCVESPSFLLPCAIRVERIGGKATIYWSTYHSRFNKKSSTWRNKVKHGRRRLSEKQYAQFLEKWADTGFDTLPASKYMCMTDGVQYTLERRTADGFKVFFTNRYDKPVIFQYLYSLSGASRKPNKIKW